LCALNRRKERKNFFIDTHVENFPSKMVGERKKKFPCAAVYLDFTAYCWNLMSITKSYSYVKSVPNV